MILVTVGTQKFQMDRLIKVVDELAGGREEPFFVQSGHSGYAPVHCEYAPFLSKEALNEKADQCSVMICHAGVGSILLGLKKNAKVIVVPRLKKFGEHVDDHQIEIAESFAKAGYIRMVTDISALAEEINCCKEWTPQQFKSNKERFNQLILDILTQ